MKTKFLAIVAVVTSPAYAGLLPSFSKSKTPAKPPQQTTLDRYVAGASAHQEQETAGPGAIWSPNSRLNDLARDLRASQVDDVVTVIVTETVNAAASGASTTERATSASSAVTSLAGPRSPTGALANLLNATGDQKLNGTGTTTRTTTLNTTLTARVVSVLPGGMLLIEGSKDLDINSEQQSIGVRGVIRTADITTTNTVNSTQIADVELKLNGKGVVGDAVRRPNAIYRFLLGLLPF